MPAKKAKRTTEEKKLLAGPCYICEKKGCQMACLHCGIAFHPHCDMHDHCPNAPAQDGDGEQDMGGVGPAMPPCDGKCGSIYANTGECGCTDEICACGYKFQIPPNDFQRQQHFNGKAHQSWMTAPRSEQPSVAAFLEVGAVPAIPEDDPLPPPSDVPILLGAPPIASQSCHTPCHGFRPPETPPEYIPLNYPIQLHAHKYRQLHGRKMDWHFPSDMLHFKSNQCSDWGVDGQPCDACTQLRSNQELKGLMAVATNPKPNTDGDKRRGAAYRSLTDRVVNVPGFRFLQIRVLHGEATVTKDLRHILKRFVRRLFSANPISIYGIAVDTNVLLLLANALSTASRLNAAFKEEDFMSVPNALTIIDGMTEIACADFADLDPSRRAQAVAIRRLHWPL